MRFDSDEQGERSHLFIREKRTVPCAAPGTSAASGVFPQVGCLVADILLVKFQHLMECCPPLAGFVPSLPIQDTIVTSHPLLDMHLIASSSRQTQLKALRAWRRGNQRIIPAWGVQSGVYSGEQTKQTS